jgi:hypothetical protein
MIENWGHAVKKNAKPDDVFERAGFRMERRGRFITLQTHRTPEEHKRFVKQIAESRPHLMAEIEKATQELIEIVHRFNSLEVLAQLWFINSVGDPNKYKEYSYEGRPPYVEHLAVLELKDPEYTIHTLKMPGGAEIEKSQELLHRIFQNTFLYHGAEGLDPERPGPIPRLQQLRFDTIIYELIVRSPTYYSHWADILSELFGRDFIAEWMHRELGFDIEQALKCVQSTSDLMMKRLVERREKARQYARELKGYVEEFKSKGKFNGPEEAKQVVDRLRNMRGKESKRAIQAIAASWAFYELHETCSFTAPELAAQAGVEPEHAEAFLALFSVGFGNTPKNYLLPSPTNPLKLRPLIRYKEKLFCPAVHLLIWALKPRIESCLRLAQPDSVNSDARLWERYQKHRSDFLVRHGLKYFRDLLPRAEIHEKLKYRIAADGVQKWVELDGLVLFDRYAYLIEGKAGELSSSARRGGQLRLVDDLKQLVAEPHRQALRASAYISSTEKPVFQTEDGATIQLEKDKYKQFFLITLTLENLDVFTKEISQLKELGIFGTSELPWSVSLSDLRIIAETVRLPTQFTHYLKWRLYLNQEIHISAQSELDWLGYYLAEGPTVLKVPEGYDFMRLTTYTTGFDDFYLYEQGERTIPAPRPSQFIPQELMLLLISLEAVGGHCYTAAGESLLNLSFSQREQLATQVREFAFRSKKGISKESKFLGEETTVIFRVASQTSEDCSALARSAATQTGRTTVVLMLANGDLDQVVDWGVCELGRNAKRQ